MICKEYSEANNQFSKSYDPNKSTSYITGANNLYGQSIMQLLPTKILAWVTPKYFNLDSHRT